MTHDVQRRNGLSSQWNVKQIKSTDTVELSSAWDCGLSRRLWFRVCVAVCTTVFASHVFEHCRFRVSSLQHFQKHAPRRMSEISMTLIHHLDLCLRGVLVIGWRLVLVESRVFLLLIVIFYCQRHELTWLASVSGEKRCFHCCHQQLTELSRMLLDFSAVTISSKKRRLCGLVHIGRDGRRRPPLGHSS